CCLYSIYSLREDLFYWETENTEDGEFFSDYGQFRYASALSIQTSVPFHGTSVLFIRTSVARRAKSAIDIVNPKFRRQILLSPYSVSN
ncbi:MAG: hypothetical protein LBI18_10900, partial [Planctomycetaceae bacterium]|nr:hypothetical protein [Planctomycetaceae bacterium]